MNSSEQTIISQSTRTVHVEETDTNGRYERQLTVEHELTLQVWTKGAEWGATWLVDGDVFGSQGGFYDEAEPASTEAEMVEMVTAEAADIPGVRHYLNGAERTRRFQFWAEKPVKYEPDGNVLWA